MMSHPSLAISGGMALWQVEQSITSTLHALNGQYYPLLGSRSFPEKPNGMSASEVGGAPGGLAACW